MTREQIFHEALEEIANPIAVAQRRAAAEGKRLDGMACAAMARDPGYLSTTAQDALDKARKLPQAMPSPRVVALHSLIQLHQAAACFQDAHLGQNSLMLRFQYEAQNGFEALGLNGFAAAWDEAVTKAGVAEPGACDEIGEPDA